MAKAEEGEFLAVDDRAPEALLKRLLFSAASAHYGTQYGRMRLRGQLNESQFAACRWFEALYERYLAALGHPRGIRTSTGERVSKGHPPDPFSRIGLEIAGKENMLVKRYEGARLAGLACGRVAFKLFWFTVIEDGGPTGYGGPQSVAKVADAIEAFRLEDSKRKRRQR